MRNAIMLHVRTMNTFLFAIHLSRRLSNLMFYVQNINEFCLIWSFISVRLKRISQTVLFIYYPSVLKIHLKFKYTSEIRKKTPNPAWLICLHMFNQQQNKNKMHVFSLTSTAWSSSTTCCLQGALLLWLGAIYTIFI